MISMRFLMQLKPFLNHKLKFKLEHNLKCKRTNKKDAEHCRNNFMLLINVISLIQF